MVIKNYHFIYKIGNGSYATVWLAYHDIKDKFFAVKMQNPEDFDDAKNEVKFLTKLKDYKNQYINNIIDSFIYRNPEYKKECYYGMVFELMACNIDYMIRKNEWKEGLNLEDSISVIKQVANALYVLHNKVKAYHADLKPDNILVHGTNSKIEKIKEVYLGVKGTYDKFNETIHEEIVSKIDFEKIEEEPIIIKPNVPFHVTLADFGSYCYESESFNESFGTRYYRAPEVILCAETDEKVDIWALGCCFYEILLGKILFDPEKDDNTSRDEYHLYEMEKLFGKVPNSLIKKSPRGYKYYSKSTGYLRNLGKASIESFEDKLNNNKTNSIAKQIFKMTLNCDPNKRTSIKELYSLLEHSD
jgi:serine/threonine protein kinase